jgi:hypothetical protein
MHPGREEIVRDDRDWLKFLGYLAKEAERYRGESAPLRPDGESFPFGGDDERGEPFQIISAC